MDQVIVLRAEPLLLPAPVVRLALPSPHMFETPNTRVSKQLDEAYAFYNKVLFKNELPAAYVHLHRKQSALGYFWYRRIGVDGRQVHEIALDPDKLNRSVENSLSTLVHEMVHLWQHEFGKISKSVHHNKEWANKMEAIGLMPSSTAKPGGKRTGMRVSHYAIKDGAFEKATLELLATGYKLPVNGTPSYKPLTKPYRTTLQCPNCRDTALAKRTIKLICGGCNTPMVDKYPR